ncbi:PilN domain-containing protein [Ectothiorhodospira shaposhnikovii]|uniref:PilN domain-containing protein n=1 Tax=Ectothiorhodospira shaposhnikovii TaxID=1054 RepID=UPI001EE83628|nr:PilN domain-containing protein [Ectothiorhodospira shaposhnikovii]MCG5514371.1 PilN domain-containing protein [Ectothiorhodospira shaposhnikovii]
MKQSINLYRIHNPGPRVWISLRNMLLLALILALVLAVHTGLQTREATLLNQSLADMRARERQLQEDLQRLRELIPPQTRADNLQADIDAMTARRERLERSIEVLQLHLPRAGVDLRAPLQALDRSNQSGLWLTGVTLDDQGRGLRLEGRALASRLVPAYLDRMTREPALAGLRFHQVRVQQAENESPGVQFVISTRPEGN